MDVPPVIAHNFVFGLKADCNDNVHFGEDDTIIYPAGHMVVIYNPRTHTQQFLFGSDVNDSRYEKAEITCIAVSPNKRFCAVAERGVTYGTISIYDQHTLKRKRFLTCTDVASQEFVSLKFTSDSSKLFSLTSGVNVCIILWSWSNSKVLHIERLPTNAVYTQISHSPNGAIACASGSTGLLFMEVSNSSPYLRVAQTDDSDPIHATAQVWTHAFTLIVGTNKGSLNVISNGRLSATMNIPQLHNSPIVGIVSIDTCILVVSKNGVIVLLQLNEVEGHGGELTWTVVRVGHTSWGDNPRCVSYCSDYGVVVTTEGGQLVRLWGWDTLTALSVQKGVQWGGGVAPLVEEQKDDTQDSTVFTVCAKPVVTWNHQGAVTGMDQCVRTGTAVTCGADHTVKIWSLQNKSLLFSTRFPDEKPLGVALHPSGWILLLSLPERVCLCMLLHKNIKIIREWNFKAASEVSFSRGGHLLAVCSSGAIHIIHTYTGKTMHTLRCHASSVRALSWAPDDESIISAGSDGDVQERNVESGSRTREFVQKGCRFLSASIGSDGVVLVAGDDNILKQLSSRGITKALDAGVTLTQLCLSKPPEKMLFAGTNSGVVRSFSFPLTGDAKDYQAHFGAITRLKLGADDSTIASTGTDGCFVLWNIMDHRAGRKLGQNGNVPLCSDVVVGIQGIDELRSTIQNLEGRLKELLEERENEDARVTGEEENQLRKITEENVLKLENGRARIEAHRDEAQERDAENQEKILSVQHQQNVEQQEQAAKFQQSYLHQVASLQNLQMKLEDIKEERKTHMRQQVLEHDNALTRITYQSKDKLRKAIFAKEQAESAHALVIARFAEDRQQTEVDLDTEVELLSNKRQDRLEAEKDTTLRLKGEAGLMMKKYKVLLSDREDLLEAKTALHAQEEQQVQHLHSLKGKCVEHEGAIVATDAQIAEREKQIYELKRNNQILERHRFVVGFQVAELKREMAPCEATVSKLQAAVSSLSQELEIAHKKNRALQAEGGHVLNELKKSNKSMKVLKGEVRKMQQQSRDICVDTMNAMTYIQDPPTLRALVLQLYNKYGSTAGQNSQVGNDVAQEYKRHVEFLNGSVKALKSKVTKDVERGRQQQLKLMRENAGLIREINSMRRELKLVHTTQRLSNNQASPITNKMLPPLKTQKNVAGNSIVATSAQDSSEMDFIKANTWRVKQNENLIELLRLEIDERQMRLQHKQAE